MTLHAAMLALVNDSHESAWEAFRRTKGDALALGLPAPAAAKWKAPGEPAFVAQLVADPALAALQQALHAHLPPKLCTGEPLISTAFIHQKPKVRFGTSEVELGDLLLIRHHFVYGDPEPQGRALLLQAKAGLSPKTGGLKGNEAEQFRLYKDWPAFEFPYGEVGCPPDGSSHWDFKRGTGAPSESGCYAVVYGRELPMLPATKTRPPFPEASPWSVGLHSHFRATSVDASRLSLASVLAGLIQGSSGRCFSAVPAAGDHWSSFIHTILANAAADQWKYRVRRVDIEGRDRLQQVMALTSRMPGLAFTVAATLKPRRPYWSQGVRSRYESLARWVDETLGGHGNGGIDDGAPDLPFRGGGPQLLYVATSGSERLPDIGPGNRDGAR
jgi:hypothetical protein